jgi:hypothetical protein
MLSSGACFAQGVSAQEETYALCQIFDEPGGNFVTVGVGGAQILMDKRKRKRLSYHQGYGKTTISTDR